MMNKEIRRFDFEIRAEETEKEKRGGQLTGLPIVFDQATDLGWYEETIDRDALNDTDLKDVMFLIGHDTSMVPLARSRNNNENSTMQMTVTNRGMEIRVDLDIEGNPRAAELYSAVKRGDITGMSFMFTVNEDKWDDIDTDHPKRTILGIRKVYEVSAVAFPAYPQTSIQAASEGNSLDSAKASLESARKAAQEERDKQAANERRTALYERLDNLLKGGKDE